ncbi:class V chitinase Chi100 [Xylaria palmicola]|nr:class V chitinase Chi100 [Xylaria palmicola]
MLSSISVKTATGPMSGMPTNVAEAKAAVMAGNYTSHRHRIDGFHCPSSCSSAMTDSGTWFAYGGADLDRIKGCNSTMLLDFALFNGLDDPKTQVSVSACRADLALSSPSAGSSRSGTKSCLPANVQQTKVTSPLELGTSGTSSTSQVASVVDALNQLSVHSELSAESCNETIIYAYSGNAAVGVYVGSGLTRQGVLPSVLKSLSAEVKSGGSVAENLMVQLCSNISTRYSMGVFIDTKGDLVSVQKSLQLWKKGSCITSMGDTTPNWQSLTYLTPTPDQSGSHNGHDSKNLTHAALRRTENTSPHLAKRTNCRTIQAEDGDTCTTLAAECGISGADFIEYNSGSTLCSSLKAGQHVCCSSADGYCYAHTVGPGDTCDGFEAAYSITEAEIEKWNKNTWGWYGCGNLLRKYTICLSSGYPPVPSNIANAVCGPQANGTTNCPLNACCNIWGQCGITAEFCTPSNSSTGAPGTAAPEQNGCISNCGTEIVTSDPPSNHVDIAYFEAWSWEHTSVHTHIHFSFVNFNEDFTIDTSMVADQLPLFLGMTGVKKIISIGGWDFSTAPEYYTRFRNAVKTEANRQKLIKNVINFLVENDLDGVDWDWEYPSEPDIPGIPAGDESESKGYFFLLADLKEQMPAGKTVSVTAPASYWYLQYFPLQAISAVVDYMVVMTYDLHGQWDYENKYATPGCPSFDDDKGNCLRSHVNSTETLNALSMVTKAGVPSNIIAVGVSSYGRSFKMTTPGCRGPECTYVGPDSAAWAGPCTNTPGYLADYEIGLIMKENPTAQEYWDSDSASSIVVFNQTEWVAYMNETSKTARKILYPLLSFLGTADWAVDLQDETGESSSGSGSDSDSDSDSTIYINPTIWEMPTPVVTAEPGATLIWPPKPLTTTTTITFPLWTTTVSYSSLKTLTSTISVTTTAIPVWYVTLDSDKTNGGITLTRSVQPPPFTVTVTPVISGNTTIIGATKTTTIPGGTYTWGSQTYTSSTVTQTWGGETTVTGGTTLSPAVVTVTPNPHPTTVDTTKDPEVNRTPTPSWTSGKPAKPTSSGGCKGCGPWPCIFCNPDCPSCPPGVFPLSSSGGGGSGGGNPSDPDDPDDPDESSSSSSSEPTMEATVLFNGMYEDVYGTTLVPKKDLQALESSVSSFLGIEVPTLTEIVTVTTTVHPVTTVSTVVVTPEPTAPAAYCDYWTDLFNYVFLVRDMKRWSEDGGSKLHKEEKGCGAIASWSYTEHEESGDYVFFTLPYLIKDGCVERTIVSAGGPKLSCVYLGDY